MTQNRFDSDGISALLDGECDSAETGGLLKRLAKDAEARERLGRYSLARDALHGELAVSLSGDFADRVRAAIDKEPTLLVPNGVAQAARAPAPRSWFKPAAGLAIAASVALVSFIGLEQYSGSGERPSAVAISQNQSQSFATVASAPRTAPAGLLQTSVGGPGASSDQATRWSVEQRDLQNRLNTYLLDHTEYARIGEMNGMLSYSRLVGYDRSR